MSYERTYWKNREVEHPGRYTVEDNGDGTVTLKPVPGNIIEEGTPIIAGNMNNIEKGIEKNTIITSETEPENLREGQMWWRII